MALPINHQITVQSLKVIWEGRLEQGCTTGQQGKAAREAEVDFWHSKPPSLKKSKLHCWSGAWEGWWWWSSTLWHYSVLSHAALKKPALRTCPVSTLHSKGRGLQAPTSQARATGAWEDSPREELPPAPEKRAVLRKKKPKRPVLLP